VSAETHEFSGVDRVDAIAIADGIRARAVRGEHITLAVVDASAESRWPVE